jgi:ribosome-associated protein
LLLIIDKTGIPHVDLHGFFVVSGGRGGQNVNKVASKAVLRWDVAASASLPDDVKARFRVQQRRRITGEGELVVASQRYRDQDRNRQDCLEKLRAWVLQATVVPKARRKTRPSRGAKERRLATKRHRSARKEERKLPRE